MARLKSEQITKGDLLEYLDSYSDFSFELSVLKMLRERNIECAHGGHYDDPVTNKSREFDIRAAKTIDNSDAGKASKRVRLAIECKNIRDNFPILISCIPRQEEESHHEIAFVIEPNIISRIAVMSLQESRANTVSLRGSHSLYKLNEPVGKSTVQVGRALDSSISFNDSELYEKWGQCLSSANDLVKRIYWDGERSKVAYLSAVFPFVVVPNGRLWMVIYDEDGNRISDPTPTDRVSCFINKSYRMGTNTAGATMQISHVEVVTFDGMTAFVDRYLNSEMAEIFPILGIGEAYMRDTEED